MQWKLKRSIIHATQPKGSLRVEVFRNGHLKRNIGETDFNFNFTKTQAVHSYNTRRSNDIRLPLPRTNWGKQTFIFHAAKDWNSLPNDLKECNILSIFKSKLKTFLKDLS